MTPNDRPLVSVLMTAYNRERYIGTAIESVLASTYGEFELIVVDDRSRDRTVEIARGYAEQDPRVRVYLNERNLGDYPNRNKAAAYATGKYLKYVDADDYLYPWGLDLLVRMMEEFPDAGWGLCSLPQVVERPYPFQLDPKQAYEHHYLGPGLFHKAPLSSIFRKEAFVKAGGFSDRRMVGDMEMWHRMALHFPVLLMPDGIVWYREHDSQEFNDAGQFTVRYEEITLQYLKDPACPLTAGQVSEILSRRKRQWLKFACFHFLRLRWGRVAGDLKIWYRYAA